MALRFARFPAGVAVLRGFRGLAFADVFMVRVVPRDLLPLPLDGMGGTLPRRSLGRKCRQRLSSETAQRQRINAAAAALNNLYGGRDEPGLRPSESQLEALLHLEAAIKADPPLILRRMPKSHSWRFSALDPATTLCRSQRAWQP